MLNIQIKNLNWVMEGVKVLQHYIVSHSEPNDWNGLHIMAMHTGNLYSKLNWSKHI